MTGTKRTISKPSDPPSPAGVSGVHAISPARARWAGVALACVLVAAAAWRSHSRAYLLSEDPRTLVDAEAICRDTAPIADGQTTMVWDRGVPNWPPLQYYLLLHWRAQIADYRSEDCKRAFIVIADNQKIEGVFATNPGLEQTYTAPTLWRTYPRAKVFLAERKPTR